MTSKDYDHDMAALVAESHALLSEIYDPAGVLIFWSARIKYLDSKRPCDMCRDSDYEGIRALNDRLNAIADGAFA